MGENRQEKQKRKKTRIFLIILASALVLSLVLAALLPFAAAGKEHETLPVWVNRLADLKPDPENRLIKVITFNMAHGRSSGPNQVFQPEEDIRKNLAGIAEMLKREKPFAAALQEADGSSLWSGSFDHTAWVAELAGYPYYCRGAHVHGLGLSYGTALISMTSPFDPQSVRFSVSSFHPPKGFIVSAFTPPWQGAEPVDIASVHLDHSSEAERKKQAAELASFFSSRNSPLILMGDFNSEWDGEIIQLLTDLLNLKAYRPEEQDLGTFTGSGRRIDWILISKQLDFISYRVLKDRLSDHYAVCADIFVY